MSLSECAVSLDSRFLCIVVLLPENGYTERNIVPEPVTEARRSDRQDDDGVGDLGYDISARARLGLSDQKYIQDT